MPKTTCNTCGSPYQWKWEEAFDKFGFADGDGQVETHIVAAILEKAGYSVDHVIWGLHNDIILSITKDGVQQIPPDTNHGYANPRKFLPAAIVRLLDDKLGEDQEVAS